MTVGRENGGEKMRGRNISRKRETRGRAVVLAHSILHSFVVEDAAAYGNQSCPLFGKVK